jgi:glutamyl-tRNA reductase
MRFSLAGINHQTAPLTIREKVAISAEELPNALALLRHYTPHGVILSTCNRTEIYTADGDGHDAEKTCLEFLKARLHVSNGKLPVYVYFYKDREASEHLFRVASGLESMIVGEFEVLGQVRQSLEAAEKAGMANLPLRHVFHSAIRTGRRVREETGISRNALSVSSVAVDLAAGIVGDLTKCKLLVIGAGEAGRLVAKIARERGASQIVIASRTKKRATALAATLRGTPIDLSHLVYELGTTHIVVTCTGAPHHILDISRVKEAMSNRPDLPLVIIDIAIPRNVEPEVEQLRNVFLYNIDDLTSVSRSNRKQRAGEVQKATEIVDAETSKFVSWWQDLEIRPLVSALMNKAEDIRSGQLSKTLKKLPSLSDEQRDVLEAMTKSIVTRILKDPIQYLKSIGNSDSSATVKELFKLDAEKRS